jgi:hypothetical protein
MSSKDSVSLDMRLAMKDRKWKLERDFHMTLFNLINWMVLWSCTTYLREISALRSMYEEKLKKISAAVGRAKQD